MTPEPFRLTMSRGRSLKLPAVPAAEELLEQIVGIAFTGGKRGWRFHDFGSRYFHDGWHGRFGRRRHGDARTAFGRVREFQMDVSGIHPAMSRNHQPATEYKSTG